MPTKKITKEEAEKMQLLPFGRKHPVRVLINELELGEYLLVSRADFRWKNHTPNLFCRQLMRASKKRFRTWKKADGLGWVIQRQQ